MKTFFYNSHKCNFQNKFCVYLKIEKYCVILKKAV